MSLGSPPPHGVPRLSPEMLDPHLSALLWMGVLATLILVIIMPQPLGVRALVIVSILRLIFSVGLEPTLYSLGGVNVGPPSPSPLPGLDPFECSSFC